MSPEAVRLLDRLGVVATLEAAGAAPLYGTTVIGHGYSGNMFAQFIDSDDPSMWDYFMPEEGGTQWVDNMAVVADAPHPCTAHAFIDFILDGENGAALSNWNYYASPNEASQPMIDEAVKPFLDKATAGVDPEKIEFITDTGDFEVNYSDAFAEARRLHVEKLRRNELDLAFPVDDQAKRHRLNTARRLCSGKLAPQNR